MSWTHIKSSPLITTLSLTSNCITGFEYSFAHLCGNTQSSSTFNFPVCPVYLHSLYWKTFVSLSVKSPQTHAGSTIQSENDLIEHIKEKFIIETQWIVHFAIYNDFNAIYMPVHQNNNFIFELYYTKEQFWCIEFD